MNGFRFLQFNNRKAGISTAVVVTIYKPPGTLSETKGENITNDICFGFSYFDFKFFRVRCEHSPLIGIPTFFESVNTYLVILLEQGFFCSRFFHKKTVSPTLSES